jgi:hypothetical protein
MKLFLSLALLVSFQALCQVPAYEIQLDPMGPEEGAEFLEHQLRGAEAVLEDGMVSFSRSNPILEIGRKASDLAQPKNRSEVYPLGDFVLLWGIGSSSGDVQMARNEYVMIWRIMNYLMDRGFRVVMNTKALAKHLKDAVETEGVSVVLFSSHGNQTGFFDYNGQRISYDIFQNKARSLYQFILSACYGTESRARYSPPSDMVMYTWRGLTNSKDLETFLMGSWTGLEGRDRAAR